MRSTAASQLPEEATVVADRRMQRWLAQEPFGEDEMFAQRLVMDTLDSGYV
ncbi:MAG TPA: hypothetical protein VFV38_29525 [Ktedonobacteraceae bacterium]|nr:hypothetical protein [Ktedonobacteraceae bacterium]